METRRYLIFFVVSFFVLWGWGKFVVPLIIPPAQNEQVENEQAENKQGENEEKANENQQQKPLEQSKLEHPSTVLVAARPGEAEEQTSELPTTAKEFANLVPAAITEPRSLTKANSSSNANSSSKNETNNKVENKVENAELKIPQHEVKTVWLGSLKEESGYYLMVELNSKGAVLTSVRMNDPRFKELDDREEPLTVIGHTRNEFFKTFQLKVDHLDKLLQKEFGLNLNEIHWKIEQQVADENDDAIVREVTFSLAIPGESLEVRKVYRLHTVEPRGEQLTTARKELPDGYWIDLDIQLVNQSLDQIKTNYTLQGPVGLPLENADNTRKFRDIQRGIQDGDEIKQVSTSASEVLEYAEEERPVRWTGTLQYIGIDVQYFAALLHPLDDQQNNPYIAETQPMLIKEDEDYESRCDISFKLISDELRLAPESETSHHYRLFVGPKREALLAEPLKATEVLNYGVFGAVAKFMLWILNSLHDKLSIPYGIAIIILTMIVRAALFPLSKKQALSAQKMKELQPEIKALQKKYKNDKEKLARAQMELFSKHNYNPFAGCLPILPQLPIFFGLYTALGNSVDLRMAPFLWADNLAAPDALFKFPFRIPFLGEYLNLLPILTVILFVVQQKMFTPPAQDKEQEMQHRMMNIMMIFFGFLFYHMPAGLCLYFIASSVWGLCERKLLDKYKQSSPAKSNLAVASNSSSTSSSPKNKFKRRE